MIPRASVSLSEPSAGSPLPLLYDAARAVAIMQP
jgi:hypothetical protein